MGRVVRRFAGLALALLVTGAGGSLAHPVAVDGDAGEWFATPAATADLGRIARSASGAGEYLWRDAVGDERPGWPAWPHDLAEVRVTADYGRLYVLARISGGAVTGGAGAPQLRVAIDLDRFTGSGGQSFGDSAGFDVGAAAAYEALVATRFGSGRQPLVVDAYGGGIAAGAQAAIDAAGVVELSVPWTALGCAQVPHAPLRLAVALFLTGADDVPLDPRDGVQGRAADAVTQNGAPGSTGTTAAELADGSLDYAFDLCFDMRGECIAPAVLNEIHYLSGANSAWIEVANPTANLVALGAFKVGDESAPGGHDGMAQFPSGTLLAPGGCFVVARHGPTFLADHGMRAGAECDPADPSTPDMLAFPAWAASRTFNLPTGGDHVLLLDGANTVVDVVTYGTGAFPGVRAHGGLHGPGSLERGNPSLDTDDCAADLADQPLPTPGGTPVPAAVATRSAAPGLRWEAPAPNPATSRATLVLHAPRAAPLRVEVLDAAGRRVRRLYDGSAAAGELRLVWDARDDRGRPVAAGLYLATATGGDGRCATRLVIAR